MKGAPVGKLCAESDVTSDALLRQLTQLARGTSQACSYQSQESYCRHSQRFKESIHGYKAELGHQYHDGPVNVDGEVVGPIIGTVTHLQRELREAKAGEQAASDQAYDAVVQRHQAENEVAQPKQELLRAEQGMLEASETTRKYENSTVRLS